MVRMGSRVQFPWAAPYKIHFLSIWSLPAPRAAFFRFKPCEKALVSLFGLPKSQRHEMEEFIEAGRAAARKVLPQILNSLE